MRRFRKAVPKKSLYDSDTNPTRSSTRNVPQLERAIRSQPHPRHYLERGWKRVRLINELAKETKTQRQLATEFGCSQSTIRDFRKRNIEDIDLVKQAMEDEYRASYTAQKSARIVELEQDVVDCNALIREEMKYEEPDSESITRVMRAKQKALRLIAEELGQIPRSMELSVEQATVKYILEGVDPANLT